MPTGHRDWPKITWKFPLVHDFKCGFGLTMGNNTKNTTIIPVFFQDNAIVDYETIKTNPENFDYATSDKPNCAAGSYVPRAMLSWEAWSDSAEIDVMKFNTMDIYTAMLNRLDAFDKKTGEDIESIIGLQHETTDEQAGPLYDGTKLFEGHGANDLSTDVPFLTTDGQLENVAFNHETFFDALHYYTNKEMLRQVTGRFKTHTIQGLLSRDISIRDKIAKGYQNFAPSMCKFQHPYTYCGKMFHIQREGQSGQYLNSTDTSAIEHLTVECRVRFNEYNPDYNFARA